MLARMTEMPGQSILNRGNNTRMFHEVFIGLPDRRFGHISSEGGIAAGQRQRSRNANSQYLRIIDMDKVRSGPELTTAIQNRSTLVFSLGPSQEFPLSQSGPANLAGITLSHRLSPFGKILLGSKQEHAQEPCDMRALPCCSSSAFTGSKGPRL